MNECRICETSPVGLRDTAGTSGYGYKFGEIHIGGTVRETWRYTPLAAVISPSKKKTI